MKINLEFDVNEDCLEGNASHSLVIKEHLIKFLTNLLEQENTFFVDVTDDGDGIENEYAIKNIY